MFDVTAGPVGGVPEPDAVLMIDPASTSAWVMVRVAVHVVDAPGASVVDGQLIEDRPGSGSATPTAVKVTLPVFVRANENVCVSPNDAPVGARSVVNATDFVNDSVLVCTIDVEVDDGEEVTSAPDGGVPVAVAVLVATPAFTSDWVITRVAVQVVDAPGAKVVDGQLMLDRPANGSVMITEVRVTLPVLVTANENVCTSPNDAPLGAVSVLIATVLVKLMALFWLIGVVVDELFDVTAGPLGGVPAAAAVLTIDPAFTSDCVMVRIAVHVVEPPGATVVDGQMIADKPANGSVTATEVRVTLPVLVTANENVCPSPKDAPNGAVSVVMATDLTRLIDFSCVTGVLVDDELDVTVGPVGGVPEVVAVFVTTPAFTSDWVMVRVAVHVVDAPGAKVVDGQLMLDRPANGSVMITEVRVTLPVLVTANENVCTSPNDAPLGAVSVLMATVLVRLIVLVWVIGVEVDELLDVTAGPVGGVPEAVAVFAITPAFTSVCVMIRVAVQVVDAPGANVVDGHVMLDRPVNGSLMLTDVRVTLPVLVTANEKV